MHENLGLVPRTHVQKVNVVVYPVIPELQKQRQMDPWDFLGSQQSLIGEFRPIRDSSGER